MYLIDLLNINGNECNNFDDKTLKLGILIQLYLLIFRFSL